MTDAPRAGPPPKKDEPRAANTAAHLENGNLNDADFTTTEYDTLSVWLEDLDEAELIAWCRGMCISVVPISDTNAMEELVASGAPAWIATDYWCCDAEQMAFAIQHATYVITFDDIDDNSDRFFARAVALAALGERVVYALSPHGEPLQLVPGRGH